MRYSARRQWAHPVLRPGSDDYPSGYDRDESGMDPPHLLPDGTVELAIQWKPSVKRIREKMEVGEATLCGLITARKHTSGLQWRPLQAILSGQLREYRQRKYVVGSKSTRSSLRETGPWSYYLTKPTRSMEMGE